MEGIEPPAASAVSAPPPPPAAAQVFGDRLSLAVAFTETLADTGVSHGLVGPREVPILWERHVLNCAVAHQAFPDGAMVIDVGSGAGLPGLALAIVRPDLQLHLVEPMQRRTSWLSATIDGLGLTNCTVHRGRAEEFRGSLRAPYVTARAVARIDRLAAWSFPLLEPDGTLVALKGSSAAEELAAEEQRLRRLGMVSAAVRSYGEGLLPTPTITLEIVVRAPSGRPLKRAAKRRTRGRRTP